MPKDPADEPADKSASTQTDLSPWESPDRGGNDSTTTNTTKMASDSEEQADRNQNQPPDTETTNTTGESEQDSSLEGSSSEADTQTASNTTSSIGSVDWSRRELGESYPVEAAYHCNECNKFDAMSLRELKAHIQTDEDITWTEYLEDSGLHRCAGCGEALATLTELYCDECSPSGGDRISCRNCGEVRVNLSDPFCSAGCAGERIEATNGPPDPLNAPVDPSEEWLQHPHRLENGIPSAAPFIENHELACRECYEYGADSLHSFAVHVAEQHDFGWGGYIHTYALRRCRVCEEPLHSLLPLYCSDVCQRSDPDPVRTCKREGCSAAVERRQNYCSHDCYAAGDA